MANRPPAALRLRRVTGFNMVRSELGLATVADTQCGFKLLSATAASLVFADQVCERFAFDVELLYRAQLTGIYVAELPVTWIHDERSTVHPVRDGMRMLRDLIKIRRIGANTTPASVSRRPLPAPGALH